VGEVKNHLLLARDLAIFAYELTRAIAGAVKEGVRK
jgi:hypothetical protein